MIHNLNCHLEYIIILILSFVNSIRGFCFKLIMLYLLLSLGCDNMKFGNILKILIEENNITQKNLAAKLNIAPSTISSYVQNMREPDFDTLKKIAVYFDVSLDYLLGMPLKSMDESNEIELLRIFRSMTDEQREIFIEQGKAFLKSNTKHKNKID